MFLHKSFEERRNFRVVLFPIATNSANFIVSVRFDSRFIDSVEESYKTGQARGRGEALLRRDLLCQPSELTPPLSSDTTVGIEWPPVLLEVGKQLQGCQRIRCDTSRSNHPPRRFRRPENDRDNPPIPEEQEQEEEQEEEESRRARDATTHFSIR